MIYFNSPQEYIITFCEGVPDFEPHRSILRTTSAPLITCPNTTCLLSNQSVLKNIIIYLQKSFRFECFRSKNQSLRFTYLSNVSIKQKILF